MLQGKLFDDKGNRMGPSFSSKNGVHYRFYISTALRGRKQHAGSVTRISAPEIEALVQTSLSAKFMESTEESLDRVDKIILSNSKIQIELKPARGKRPTIQISWMPRPVGSAHLISTSGPDTDPKLAKSIVRAHAWLNHLSTGRYKSVEDLALEAKIHPKIVRQDLRLAFLPPNLTSSALQGDATIALKQIPKSLPLCWRAQDRVIG